MHSTLHRASLVLALTLLDRLHREVAPDQDWTSFYAATLFPQDSDAAMRFAALLRHAKEAHTEYERSDPPPHSWAEWYADHILRHWQDG